MPKTPNSKSGAQDSCTHSSLLIRKRLRSWSKAFPQVSLLKFVLCLWIEAFRTMHPICNMLVGLASSVSMSSSKMHPVYYSSGSGLLWIHVCLLDYPFQSIWELSFFYCVSLQIMSCALNIVSFKIFFWSWSFVVCASTLYTFCSFPGLQVKEIKWRDAL